jgi:hypothetical protein
MPGDMATMIDLAVTACTFTLNGLGELLIGSDEVIFEAGADNCTELEAVEGSGPLTFEVQP